VAERVIARDGHGASIEAIAAEAGVTKPIVYARVGGRAMLSDLLANRLADRLMVAARAVVGRTDVPGRDTVAALFATTLETIGHHRELFLFVTRGTAGDTPERALYLAGRSATPLAELLVQWRSVPEHDVASAQPWAYALVGMLNMVALWWTESDGASPTLLAERLADLVWPGLAPGR
jgi:AcrR family transcriptional regulator